MDSSEEPPLLQPAFSSDNLGLASGSGSSKDADVPAVSSEQAVCDSPKSMGWSLPAQIDKEPSSSALDDPSGGELEFGRQGQVFEADCEREWTSDVWDDREEIAYYRGFDEGSGSDPRIFGGVDAEDDGFDEALQRLIGRDFEPSELGVQLHASDPEARIDDSVADPVFVQERMLDELVRYPAPPAGFKLPWERGPMKSIFSEHLPQLPSLGGMPRRCMPDPLPLVAASSAVKASKPASTSEPIFKLVVKAVKDVGFIERREEMLQVSVHRLAISLELVGNASVPPELLHQGRVDAESLEAALGVRSPLTITKRANNLASYIKWCTGEKVMGGCFFREATVWEYLCQSRGADCVSMLRFLHYVLGLDLAPILKSRRISGITEQMRTGKGWIKQAAPISLSEILFLHQLLEEQRLHKYDLAMVSYVLIALYARARHSDLADVQNVNHDHSPAGGFLIIELGQHKTRRAQARCRELLPVLIPAIGVHGKSWLGLAQECLENAGLSLEGELKGPILRAPANSYGDSLCSREVRSNEITSFLRKVLQPVSSKDRLACVSSHSLKRTLLSWAAKFGLSDDTCSVLGRHTSATVSSRALYALDLATAPARELQRMILEVAAKRFVPDAARSEYFPLRPGPSEPCAPTLHKQDQTLKGAGVQVKTEDALAPEPSDLPAGPILVDSESDSSSSESSDSGSSEDESESSKEPSKVPRLEVDWPREQIALHVKSRIAHRIVFTSEGGTMVFSCGRSGAKNFKKLEGSRAALAFCQTCRKADR
ncbi:METTL21B [Symbiodinium sp. CCMP2592]|nr:METTL21B [Symbiodinium sp. CCMP2592]